MVFFLSSTLNLHRVLDVFPHDSLGRVLFLILVHSSIFRISLFQVPTFAEVCLISNILTHCRVLKLNFLSSYENVLVVSVVIVKCKPTKVLLLLSNAIILFFIYFLL